MGQLNMQLTPEFQRNLERAMKKLGARTKSEAIRRAIEEAAKKPAGGRPRVSWRDLLETARTESARKTGRFASHADLWRDDT